MRLLSQLWVGILCDLLLHQGTVLEESIFICRKQCEQLLFTFFFFFGRVGDHFSAVQTDLPAFQQAQNWPNQHAHMRRKMIEEHILQECLTYEVQRKKI